MVGCHFGIFLSDHQDVNEGLTPHPIGLFTVKHHVTSPVQVPHDLDFGCFLSLEGVESQAREMLRVSACVCGCVGVWVCVCACVCADVCVMILSWLLPVFKRSGGLGKRMIRASVLMCMCILYMYIAGLSIFCYLQIS